ncbi:MAG: DUF4432 family protein [Clostridia bacterium]|nr:DUF4432 family protein [Clostridia bacterium]
MNKKVSNVEQLCSVRKLKFYDGKENNDRILEVNNGCLSFMLLQDRGLDIHSLYYKGMNVSYVSKNGICGFETDFRHRFNGGMLYTCGLKGLGLVGNEPMHGRYHNTPSNLESIKCDENGVEIVASTYESTFGKKLKLTRKISCEQGSSKILIENTIKNEAFTDDNYCILFHMNIGYPMLDSGVEIVAPIKDTVARNDCAQQGIDECLIMSEPIDGGREQCYYHFLEEGRVEVVNHKLRKKIIFTYDLDKLPYFVEWKYMISGDYALGIEPTTSLLDDKFALKTIKSQEEVKINVAIEIQEF